MSGWPGWRINHHQADHGALLRDSVAPLVADIRAREDARILVRPHWSEGPHVLVAMDVDPERFAAEFYEQGRARIERWLRSNPSRAGLDPDAHRRQVLQLSEMEAEPAGPDRLADDNTVEPGRYERPAPYGIAELGAIRDDFQVRTLDAALNMVARRLDSRPAFMVELATWIASAGLSGGEDFDFWPISMLAHYEGFLSGYRGLQGSFEGVAAKLRPALEQAWRDNGIIDGARPPLPAASPDLLAWSAALERLNDALEAVVERRDDLRASAAMYDSGGTRSFLHWDGASLKALLSIRAHLRYRIMINFVYGLFPLLGLKPAERAFLCYLIWQTVEGGAPELIARADRSVLRAARGQQAA